MSGRQGTQRWVSPGLAAAGAELKQGFSSRLSSGKLQNKRKLCKTSCRRTLVLNRHVVRAAKAPAQGERDLISFLILLFDCKSSQSTSCPGAGASPLGTPSLSTSYPAPRRPLSQQGGRRGVGGLSLSPRLPGEGQDPDGAAPKGQLRPARRQRFVGMERKAKARRWLQQEG